MNATVVVAPQCDQRDCTAVAKATVTLSGGSLSFCGHHAAEHRTALQAHPGVVLLVGEGWKHPSY